MAVWQIAQFIEFGAILAAFAAAAASLIFCFWAFAGRRDLRNRQLRVALSSFLIMIAGIGIGLSLFKFVVMPSEMAWMHPEYSPRFETWHQILSVATLISIVAAAGLAVWALLGTPVNKSAYGSKPSAASWFVRP